MLLKRGNEQRAILFFWLSGALFFFFGLFLTRKLFKAMETRHPEKFVEMGKPHVILNNTPRLSFFLMKFLLQRQWHEYHDEGMVFPGNSEHPT